MSPVGGSFGYEIYDVLYLDLLMVLSIRGVK